MQSHTQQGSKSEKSEIAISQISDIAKSENSEIKALDVGSRLKEVDVFADAETGTPSRPNQSEPGKDKNQTKPLPLSEGGTPPPVAPPPLPEGFTINRCWRDACAQVDLAVGPVTGKLAGYLHNVRRYADHHWLSDTELGEFIPWCVRGWHKYHVVIHDHANRHEASVSPNLKDLAIAEVFDALLNHWRRKTADDARRAEHNRALREARLARDREVPVKPVPVKRSDPMPTAADVERIDRMLAEFYPEK
jgi:hypothetical protein